MFNKLKPKSEFTRNVLTLMTGTTIAQAIPIAISPILTRLYAPEDFGLFALYTSIVAILSLVATGRYELAILLPKRDEDALHLLFLAVALALGVSLLTFMIVIIWNGRLSQMLGNPEISPWLYLVPVSIFLTSLYQSLYYWANRKKEYKNLSKSRVTQSIATAILNLLMGYKKMSSGLILGGIVGQLLSIRLLFKSTISSKKSILESITRLELVKQLKRYSDFPKFLVFAHGMNTMSQQIPIILLGAFYSPSAVGFYMIIQRVVRVPMGIVASAISDVFREKASREYLEKQHALKSYLATLRLLILISIVPSIIFYFIAPELFAFVFGEKWRVAGVYAQILTPMFFLQFVTSPLSGMFMIAEKQSLDLRWQLFLFISTLSAFYIGDYLFGNIKTTLALFTLAYSVAYIINLYMTYRFAKGVQ